MLFDRTVDLCGEVLHKSKIKTGPDKAICTPSESKETERGVGGDSVRTFFKEAIFIACAFLGAAYLFPFFVVEEDEIVAFCFEVCIPLIFP